MQNPVAETALHPDLVLWRLSSQGSPSLEELFFSQTPVWWYMMPDRSRQLSRLMISSQMQEVWGSNPRLGRLQVKIFQASEGMSTLQSRASGLVGTTQGNSIRTKKTPSQTKQRVPPILSYSADTPFFLFKLGLKTVLVSAFFFKGQFPLFKLWEIRITTISCTTSFPRVGWPGHLLLTGVAVRLSKGWIRAERCKQCDATRDDARRRDATRHDTTQRHIYIYIYIYTCVRVHYLR